MISWRTLALLKKHVLHDLIKFHFVTATLHHCHSSTISSFQSYSWSTSEGIRSVLAMAPALVIQFSYMAQPHHHLISAAFLLPRSSLQFSFYLSSSSVGLLPTSCQFVWLVTSLQPYSTACSLLFWLSSLLRKLPL